MKTSYLTIHRSFPNQPDSAVHSHMDSLARRAQKPQIIAVVEYADGSRDDCFEIFEPATRTVSYRTADGDTHTVEFDRPTTFNGGWMFDHKDLTKKEIHAGLMEWFKKKGEVPTSLKLVSRPHPLPFFPE